MDRPHTINAHQGRQQLPIPCIPNPFICFIYVLTANRSDRTEGISEGTRDFCLG
jgi:hypothetical protein